MDAVPDVRRCIHLDEDDVCHSKSIRFDWNVAIIKLWNSGWYSFRRLIVDVRRQSPSLSTSSISIASSFSSVYRENIGIRSIRHWKSNKYDALIPEDRRIPLTICPTIDDHDKCTANTEHFLSFVSTSGETCFPRNRFTDSVENSNSIIVALWRLSSVYSLSRCAVFMARGECVTDAANCIRWVNLEL